MVKNVPKSKKSIYFIKFDVLHLISLDFNSFLSQTVKKIVLAGEHQFYHSEMQLMKLFSVRNNQASKLRHVLLKQRNPVSI